MTVQFFPNWSGSTNINNGCALKGIRPPLDQPRTMALLYALCYAPSEVLLQPVEKWPQDRPLPQRLSFDGTYIRADREGFIANGQFLQGHKFCGAIFANCGSVNGSKRFAATSRNVLKKCRSIVIIHNEDTLEELLEAFQDVESLSLPHDLRAHLGGLRNWVKRGKLHPLRHLTGSSTALSLYELALDGETLNNVVRVCPQISGILSNLEDVTSKESGALPIPSSPLSHVVFGRYLDHGSCNVTISPEASPSNVEAAAYHSPCVHCLHVTTGSRETVSNIVLFKNISELSITYTSRKAPCPFDVCEVFIRRFKLQHLQLYQFEGVNVSSIADHSGSLVMLRLFKCTFTDQVLEAGRFRGLQILSLGSEVSNEIFLSLLGACPSLVVLELFVEVLTARFLLPEAQALKFPHLNALLLTTRLPAEKLGVTTGDLEQLLLRLPSLRYLRTDDYGIRLFFQATSPDVTLGWTTCTVCLAEYPRVNGNDVCWEDACRRRSVPAQWSSLS